jgi:hypothetical protein
MVRARLVSVNPKCSKFFFGLLQGVKRGCNVVPRYFINKAIEKHVKTLTTPTKSILNPFLYGEFTSLTRRIVRGFDMSMKQILKITEPSKSSTYQYMRHMGGQDTAVREAFGIPSSIDELTADPSEAGAIALSTLQFFDQLYSMVDTESGIGELRGHSVTKEDKLLLLRKEHQSLCIEKDGLLTCRIVALSEPLKVRIISAGDGVPYYLSKPFQRALFNHIQPKPQFKLIGEPLQIPHLLGIMDREAELRKYVQNLNTDVPFPDTFWVSGDYSAATDNLKIEYTLQAFDVVAKEMLDTSMRNSNSDLGNVSIYLDVVRKLLEPHGMLYKNTPHLISFLIKARIPFTVDPSYVCVLQETGQLMGSPISFPFLCIINIVCYWSSLNTYYGRTIPLRLLPVLVNGDDILFRSNPAHYAIWKEMISEVGFTLSLGKNYTHPTLLTVNSELYEFNPSKNGLPEFRKHDYFNIGLLISQSKGRLADPYRKLSLVQLYRSSVGCAHDKARAHRRFIHYNKCIINQMTDRGKYNLFIPVHLGGLGFPLYKEVKPLVQFTHFQRRFASFLIMRTEEQMALGKYPKKYFCALVTDNTPIKSLIRRSGFPEMRLGPVTPSSGWKLFLPKDPVTMLPLSAAQSVVMQPEMEYRLPAKSILRDFNRNVIALKDDLNSALSYSMRCLSDLELLDMEHSFIHVRDHTWCPSGPDIPSLLA